MNLDELIETLQKFHTKYGPMEIPVKLCVETDSGQAEAPLEDVGVCLNSLGDAKYIVLMSPDV